VGVVPPLVAGDPPGDAAVDAGIAVPPVAPPNAICAATSEQSKKSTASENAYVG